MTRVRKQLTKTTKTSPYAPPGGWKIWLAQMAVGALMMSVWAPIADLLELSDLVRTIIFVIGYVIFWMSAAGRKTTEFLERMIRREG